MTRMADILAKPHLATLGAFASSNVLLAFDYDGTLAPTVPTPSRAHLRAETRRLLVEIARRYPCVVISGRRLDDVSRRLDGIPIWYVFGNFGNEPAAANSRSSDTVRDWMPRLAERLPTARGMVVEEKTHSVTIHYRHVRDKRRALAAIEAAIRELPDVRIVGGLHAVNLLPGGGSDKGVALQRARRQFACDHAIYVGDDETDEDAFTSAGPERLLSIRVGASRMSRARYCLTRQADVDTLLRILVSLRAHESGLTLPSSR